MVEKKSTAYIRVFRERNDLWNNMIRLYRYLLRSDAQQRDLLEKQLHIMESYLKVLDERLETWDENNDSTGNV